jgi:hypothetical protein
MHNESNGIILTRHHIMITASVAVVLIASSFVAGFGAGKRAVLSAEAIPDTLSDIDDRARAADMMFYGTLGDIDDPFKPDVSTPMQSQAEVVLMRALKSNSPKSGEYTLHVTKTGRENKNKTMISQLRTMGFSPIQFTTEEGEKHVRLGRFESKSQAERARAIIQRKSIEAEVVQR